jgi:hypothetical protein
MTAHPTDGLIRAFLDNEIEPAGRHEILAHLDDCAACQGVVQEVRSRDDRVTLALEKLDTMPPTDFALAALKRRVRETARPRFRIQGLGRAAAVALLLLGGAASALPGSPVREWISSGWDRITGGSALEEGVTPPEDSPIPSPASEEAGAGIGVSGGIVELRVEGLPEGEEITVLLVEGDQAGIYGPASTRFRTEDGRVEAFVTEGGIRVELPRAVNRATVVVNGIPYLRKSGDSLEILGPVKDSAAAEIRFRGGAGTGSTDGGP